MLIPCSTPGLPHERFIVAVAIAVWYFLLSSVSYFPLASLLVSASSEYRGADKSLARPNSQCIFYG